MVRLCAFVLLLPLATAAFGKRALNGEKATPDKESGVSSTGFTASTAKDALNELDSIDSPAGPSAPPMKKDELPDYIPGFVPTDDPEPGGEKSLIESASKEKSVVHSFFESRQPSYQSTYRINGQPMRTHITRSICEAPSYYEPTFDETDIDASGDITFDEWQMHTKTLAYLYSVPYTDGMKKYDMIAFQHNDWKNDSKGLITPEEWCTHHDIDDWEDWECDFYFFKKELYPMGREGMCLNFQRLQAIASFYNTCGCGGRDTEDPYEYAADWLWLWDYDRDGCVTMREFWGAWANNPDISGATVIVCPFCDEFSPTPGCYDDEPFYHDDEPFYPPGSASIDVFLESDVDFRLPPSDGQICQLIEDGMSSEIEVIFDPDEGLMQEYSFVNYAAAEKTCAPRKKIWDDIDTTTPPESFNIPNARSEAEPTHDINNRGYAPNAAGDENDDSDKPPSGIEFESSATMVRPAQAVLSSQLTAADEDRRKLRTTTTTDTKSAKAKKYKESLAAIKAKHETVSVGTDPLGRAFLEAGTRRRKLKDKMTKSKKKPKCMMGLDLPITDIKSVKKRRAKEVERRRALMEKAKGKAAEKKAEEK